ncbi:TetR/AcrR family transcriptional regulator [Nocardia tengchongensis]|uniref:TetR/AcrR family transcriptional regulator n=1 Tax=Nocardia tengchongensis TaxID=2055889 RepID=A0ABX8CPW1_9NOCA|nr:TetR/AcrR family transcriptional regulator [Nocardia tengchongensis]QVI21053.1 TetR/AcrR family transcriptional regulator [Nocardia tengchongensis]
MSAHPILRPTLAERRKQETRMDIARTAARLFAEYGTAAVTAEQIASESGVALRTFYRYARTKEEAVEPLLATGAQRWLELVAAGPHRLPTLPELEAAIQTSLTFDGALEDLETTRGLIHAMDDDPALRTLWHRINLEGERDLFRVLTDLGGPTADPLQLRLLAAAAAGAIRIAVEQWASADASPTGEGSPADLAVRSLRALAGGIGH